jgi:hypothetical protein
MKKSEIKLVQAIVCDDIRIENNGKFIFIGAYFDNIVLPNLPSILFLALWFRIKIQLAEKTSLEVRIKGSALDGSEVKLPDIDLSDDQIIGQNIDIPILWPKIKLELMKEGEIEIIYREKKVGKWKLATRMSVIKASNLSTKVSFA